MFDRFYGFRNTFVLKPVAPLFNNFTNSRTLYVRCAQTSRWSTKRDNFTFTTLYTCFGTYNTEESTSTRKTSKQHYISYRISCRHHQIVFLTNNYFTRYTKYQNILHLLNSRLPGTNHNSLFVQSCYVLPAVEKYI